MGKNKTKYSHNVCLVLCLYKYTIKKQLYKYINKLLYEKSPKRTCYIFFKKSWMNFLMKTEWPDKVFLKWGIHSIQWWFCIFLFYFFRLCRTSNLVTANELKAVTMKTVIESFKSPSLSGFLWLFMTLFSVIVTKCDA
jgi:hypothetical protein